jgi:hypothetical protein
MGLLFLIIKVRGLFMGDMPGGSGATSRPKYSVLLKFGQDKLTIALPAYIERGTSVEILSDVMSTKVREKCSEAVTS